MRISSDDAFSLILFNVLCEYLATSEDSSFSFLMCPSRPLTNSAISAGNICCFTGTGAAASLLVDSVAAAYPEPPRPGLVDVETAGTKICDRYPLLHNMGYIIHVRAICFKAMAKSEKVNYYASLNSYRWSMKNKYAQTIYQCYGFLNLL